MVKPGQIVQEWLQFSRRDLQAARFLSSTKDETMSRTIGFLCQQSAEKAIKAFLAHKKVKFGKIHDLQVLGDEVTKISPSVKGLMIRAISLTPYAVEFRYPESADKPLTLDQAGAAIDLAGFILQAMIDLMEQEDKV